MSLATRIGILKSKAIYCWKPFNQWRLRRFYGQFVKPGALCFDLGAHLGNRTLAWSSLGARVIAIEPQPACVEYLNRRFRAFPDVVIVDKAIGGRIGDIDFYVSSANPTISTVSDASWREQLNQDARYPVHWDQKITVKMTTLDQLMAEYGIPSFCKIDVENAEYEVLMGLSVALRQLSFEYYPAFMHTAYLCLDRLDQLGAYEYNWSFGESLRFESDRWLKSSDLKKVLGGYKTRRHYGDIYARLIEQGRG